MLTNEQKIHILSIIYTNVFGDEGRSIDDINEHYQNAISLIEEKTPKTEDKSTDK